MEAVISLLSAKLTIGKALLLAIGVAYRAVTFWCAACYRQTVSKHTLHRNIGDEASIAKATRSTVSR